MKYLTIFLILLFSFGLSFSSENQRISSPTEFIQQPFDIIHYDLTLDLTKAPLTEMNGICKILLNWNGNPDSCKFFFHLRDLVVDSAIYENERVTPVAIEDETSEIYHYEITPPVGFGKDLILITIYYSGTATDELGSGYWGGVHKTSTSLYALGVGFQNNYVSTTEHWMPCYDHPSDKATFSGKFIVKPEHTVASIGELISIENDGDNKIFNWVHNIQCATYLYTFAVDNYIPIEISGSDIPIVVYSRANDTTACKFAFKKVPAMLEAFGSRFGEYPFEKVGYVLTSLGAMEHQTMISFPTSLAKSYYSNKDTIALTAAHELAHQWFGDFVTCLDFRDAWLNEGFATFSEAIWYEHLFGYNQYLQHILSKVKDYISTTKSEGVFPLYDFPRASPSSNYPNTIYEKGAVVVAMMRYELGDSLFFIAIREYLNKLAFSNATSELLEKTLEEVSGKDLSWFFNQWVYGLGYPQLYITVEKYNKDNGLIDAQVKIKQDQPKSYGAYFNLPIDLNFVSGNDKYNHTLLLTDIEQTFNFENIPDFSNILFNDGPNVRSLFEVKNLIITDVPNITSNSEEISIYPNPAQDAFNIKIFSNKNVNSIISLYNNIGNKVYSTEIEIYSNSSSNLLINSENLEQGIYYIKIQQGENVYWEKVIIIGS
ncbi:MAG TPA: M1 family aminopeptidase [Candidatus Kapabacteria bacterium]|nr:M1 family aminopeptidase [Candidatus Kapabacteria bacterium]